MTPEEVAVINADYPGTLLDHVRELRTKLDAALAEIDRLTAENTDLRVFADRCVRELSEQGVLIFPAPKRESPA